MQHPTASAYEVDGILSSRWCDVLNSIKGRFFLRAREALSDDDRRSLQNSSVYSNFGEIILLLPAFYTNSVFIVIPLGMFHFKKKKTLFSYGISGDLCKGSS